MTGARFRGSPVKKRRSAIGTRTAWVSHCCGGSPAAGQLACVARGLQSKPKTLHHGANRSRAAIVRIAGAEEDAMAEATKRVAVVPGDDAAPEAVYAALDVLKQLELPIAWTLLPDGETLSRDGSREAV